MGNREMNPVPVSDYKESPEEGKRRSRRMHVKPLAYWKNERIVYGPHDEEGELGEEMGCMPVPTSVLTALPTPRKHRKQAVFAAGAKRGRPAQAGFVEDEKPFDSSRMRKKYTFIDGETAQIWDEALEDATDESKSMVHMAYTVASYLTFLFLLSQRLCRMSRISLTLICLYREPEEGRTKARLSAKQHSLSILLRPIITFSSVTLWVISRCLLRASRTQSQRGLVLRCLRCVVVNPSQWRLPLVILTRRKAACLLRQPSGSY